MARKLNQIVAIEKGVKSRVYGEFTRLHKSSQRADRVAGFNKTCPAPKRPNASCGIVWSSTFTRIKFFFARSIALRMAEGTSLALPLA